MAVKEFVIKKLFIEHHKRHVQMIQALGNGLSKEERKKFGRIMIKSKANIK